MEKCKGCGEVITSQKLSDGYCENCIKNKIDIDVGANSISGSDYELYLLIIPVLGILLTYMWVGSMSLLENPSNSLIIIGFIVVISTGLLAVQEIKTSSNTEMSAFKWFVFFLLLWIIAYPVYLSKRKELGLKSKFKLGIFLALLFLLVQSMMFITIEKQKDNFRQQFLKSK